MRAGLIETGKTFIWQKRLKDCAVATLHLNRPGYKYMNSKEVLASLAARLESFSADIVYLGSGDCHHLALPLIAKKARRGPLSVLVFDQHLDCFAAPPRLCDLRVVGLGSGENPRGEAGSGSGCSRKKSVLAFKSYSFNGCRVAALLALAAPVEVPFACGKSVYQY